MKIQYKLVTIKLKVGIFEGIKVPFIYKELIKLFRACQDVGIIEVEYFDNRKIEKRGWRMKDAADINVTTILEDDAIMKKVEEYHRTKSITKACEIADDLYKLIIKRKDK